MFDVKESVKKDPITVMIVDDSAIIRGFLMKALSNDPEITILTTAANGVVALNYIKKYEIEVLILDIEMPEMDGMTALPELIKASPDLKIIMVSTLTSKNAPIAIKALSLGASDYIEKPTTQGANNVEFFNLELVNKVKSLGYSARIAKAYKAKEALEQAGVTPSHTAPLNKPGNIVDAPVTTSLSSRLNLDRPSSIEVIGDKNKPVVTLNTRALDIRPAALAIACSTGGPQALQSLFTELKNAQNLKNIPIFITQHMPPIFTKYLASHLAKISGMDVVEATDGEPVVKGKVYIAPGNYHMEAHQDPGKQAKIRLSQAAPENYCRPSANPMLRSLVRIYQDKILLVVLTGMGQDGLEGAKEVSRLGGLVLAQDEATSVVWGMPGAVAHEGLCSAVWPVDKIAAYVAELHCN